MKKLLVLVAAALLISGNSFAQLDPDDNGVGIYFDPCGCCLPCVTLPEGEAYAWLVITHPSAPAGIGGWECRIEVEGPAAILSWNFEGQDPINFTQEPNFLVGLSAPLINPFTFPTVVVMEIHFLVMDVQPPIEFFLEPNWTPSIDGELVYADGANPNELIIMRQSTGGPGEPVAVVNGDCPVANEDATWGQVKTLYR
jgi:hypothetical protein